MRSDILKNKYHLEPHPEGGWFAEVYTSTESVNGRPLSGSIYFMLESGEISHFHQIDCDEIWYFHEGCGMRIIVITEDGTREYLLGMEEGESAMVIIPKGAIFAAENLSDDGYTFISCMTTPGFQYEGFRLVGREELSGKYPDLSRFCLD